MFPTFACLIRKLVSFAGKIIVEINIAKQHLSIKVNFIINCGKMIFFPLLNNEEDWKLNEETLVPIYTAFEVQSSRSSIKLAKIAINQRKTHKQVLSQRKYVTSSLRLPLGFQETEEHGHKITGQKE